jgi:hypothetical protein
LRQAPGQFGQADGVDAELREVFVRVHFLARQFQQLADLMLQVPCNALGNREPLQLGPAIRIGAAVVVQRFWSVLRNPQEAMYAAGLPHHHEVLRTVLRQQLLEDLNALPGLERDLPTGFQVQVRGLVGIEPHAAVPPQRPIDGE